MEYTSSQKIKGPKDIIQADSLLKEQAVNKYKIVSNNFQSPN
jgi:hypothetical protein